MLNASESKPAPYHTMSSGNIVEALIRKTLLDDAIPTHTENALNKKAMSRRKSSPRFARVNKEETNNHIELKRDREIGSFESKTRSSSKHAQILQDIGEPLAKKLKSGNEKLQRTAETEHGLNKEEKTPASMNGKDDEEHFSEENRQCNSDSRVDRIPPEQNVSDVPKISGGDVVNGDERTDKNSECSAKTVTTPDSSTKPFRNLESDVFPKRSKQEPSLEDTKVVTSNSKPKCKTVGMTISNMIEQTLHLVVNSALKSDETPDRTASPSTVDTSNKDQMEVNGDKRTKCASPALRLHQEKNTVVSSSNDYNRSSPKVDKAPEKICIPHVGPKKKVLAALNQFSMEQILTSPVTKEHPKKSLLWRAVEECSANSPLKSSTSNGFGISSGLNIATSSPSCSVSCSSSPGLEQPLTSPDDMDISANNSGASDTGAISPTEGANATSSGSKDKKKKRKRCGVCGPCMTKQNCGECSSCKNRRTGHQICKQRKCIELRKKLTDPCQSLPTQVPSISAEGVNKMKQTKIPNAAVPENAQLVSGFPPGLVPSLGKLPPAVALPDKPWGLPGTPSANGFLPHFSELSGPPIQEPPHTHKECKPSGNPHSEIGNAISGFKELKHLQQYWNREMFAKHAAARVPSPSPHNHPDTHMLHRNSGNGTSKEVPNNHQSKPRQYSPHTPQTTSTSPSAEMKHPSSHFPHNQHLPHTSHLSQETYSPVDLAAESLLKLSGSIPSRRGFTFPVYHNNTDVSEKDQRQVSKDNDLKPSHAQESSSPFTKVSHINKLTTSEGYAVLAGSAHTGASTHSAHSSQPGLHLGEKITTPSPKVHVLPTHISQSSSSKSEILGSSASDATTSAMQKQTSRSEIAGSATAGYQTPERTIDSPSKFGICTPEEEERLRMLSNNEKAEAPKCGCLEQDPDEAPFYSHLGAGPSVPAIRKLMEKRLNKTGKCIRIEKVVYSGKEGKSSQGCPIAKWIIRRSNEEEKLLVLVRNRPGHHCETAYIIIAIVAWEGVDQKDANYLYELLRTTLPLRAIPTIRKCATNEEKTCACQGFNPDTCGASFSFGCSWSMYYNACKFARSKTPRKFKLQDSDPEGEETLEAHFQHLAGSLGPLYKTLAPDSYGNQVAFENHAIDCRLGHAEGRPFSGVTACMDFCAHAHRDQQNMNNGATVVVTLTKESIRQTRPQPGDEQLHILPLYYLDSTDEFGSSEGQQEKVRNGSLEVLTAYRHKSRLRQKPVIPKGAIKPRNNSQDKSSPGKASKTVANLLANASKSSRSEEKKNSSSSSLPAASTDSPENSKELKKSNRSAFANPKEASSSWTDSKSLYPHDMDSVSHPGWSKEIMNGTYFQGRHGPNLANIHPELLNGLRQDGVMSGINPLPQEYMSLFPQYPFLPPGYPAMALNGMLTPEQIQQLQHLQQSNPHVAQYLPPYAMEAYLMGNPYMRFPHYPHMEHVDVKPDPQQLNEIMRQSFGKMYAMRNGSSHNSPCDSKKEFSKTSEHKHSLNGVYPKGHSSKSASQFSDAIWRPPIFHKEEPNAASTTPINAMEKSVNSLPNHSVKREDAKNNKNIPSYQSGCNQVPKFPQTYPLKNDDLDQRQDSSPEPAEEEYYSDSEKCFEDPTIGGVAIALTHGSVLFEVAKRELHATSSLLAPCRQMPTRISLVFYQHKQLNYKNHGLEMYEKKVEAKRALQMEEGKLPQGGKKGQKRSAPSDDSKSPAKSRPKKGDKSEIPTKRAVTSFTDTVVTVASYAPTKVTGPYESPQGKSSSQASSSSATSRTS
ncbi:Methylcytosine dioxygenase TET2 [Holothuria leucospilota]|uniref:Methylcytosine dioxygenase TET n=1 Tax=Holothuria leucospilota TaxID=206669 RepID=A0A9Q0YK97_HOLLE|nr:Methylcytosine dioxygenase TET2 [Holothuria leucospilota]